MFVNVLSTVKFLLWLPATIIDIVGVSMLHFARSCMHIVTWREHDFHSQTFHIFPAERFK